MFNKYSSWLLYLFVLAAMYGCKNKTHKEETILVDIMETTGADANRQTQYPGMTEASENTELSFKVMGTIEKIYVREGDHVSKGQVVARIDSRDYATQLSATESEYRQVKAECDRVIAMHEDDAVSDNNYDKARSGLERISAKLKNHRDQLNDCQLRAPYDGYVDKVFRTAGESAAPGLSVIGLFTAGNIEVVINVPESEYLRKDATASYTATFAALPGRSFPLTLASVAQRANGNNMFQMRLRLPANTSEVTPGMSAMVDIVHSTDSTSCRILVPAGALFNDGGQAYVYVYEKGTGTVSRTAVTVDGFRSDGQVIITDGLRVGQPVVSSGVGKLTDGQQVKPLVEASEENYGKIL